MFIRKLSYSNIELLKSKPETGMGYQIIHATETLYFSKKFLVLNGEYAIDIETKNFKEVFDQLFGRDLKNDFKAAKEVHVTINSIIADDKRIGSFVKEGGTGKSQSAKEGEKEKANGDELFVRLSAFENDIRIDKQNRCLRPGSYTTTASDALRCKLDKADPVDRYALPNQLEIEWAFYIQPMAQDTLQRGWVQPDFGKKGGGREVYFESGTSYRTFIAKNKWSNEYSTATK